MKIRPVQHEDIGTITAIYKEAVLHGTASFELTPPTQITMTSRIEKITSANYPYLIAELDEQVVGYAYGSAFRDRPAYRWSVEDSIYINPDFHGRGIGKALLTELISRCSTLGFRQMIAIIGDSANHGSIKLHKTLDFEHVGIMKATGQKHGRWINTVIMQKPLGEAGTSQPDLQAYPGTLFKSE